MSTKSGSRELIWIISGAFGLLIAFFTVLYLQGNRDPIAQIAFKEQRLTLVSAMRLSLAAASEAQNSAVMSTGEQDSKTFTEEARSATAALEQQWTEFEQLTKGRTEPRETELLSRVGHSLREFQRIDSQLLDLAAQNSNRKAFGLAFGPAMTLLKEIDGALAKIAGDEADPSSDNRRQVMQLASEVRIGILSMQVLLLPHIAEASDLKMDQFELELSAHDRKVRENFAELTALLPKSDQSNIETATSRYAEFDTLKSQILKLSRQNTDVRAVAIALKEKRQAMLACQDALVALERAIRAEPITSTIPSGRSP